MNRNDYRPRRAERKKHRHPIRAIIIVLFILAALAVGVPRLRQDPGSAIENSGSGTSDRSAVEADASSPADASTPTDGSADGIDLLMLVNRRTHLSRSSADV